MKRSLSDSQIRALTTLDLADEIEAAEAHRWLGSHWRTLVSGLVDARLATFADAVIRITPRGRRVART